MKKAVFAALLCLLSFHSLNAQDTIVLHDESVDGDIESFSAAPTDFVELFDDNVFILRPGVNIFRGSVTFDPLNDVRDFDTFLGVVFQPNAIQSIEIDILGSTGSLPGAFVVNPFDPFFDSNPSSVNQQLNLNDTDLSYTFELDPFTRASIIGFSSLSAVNNIASRTDYELRLTLVNAAIPEPATWLMMIIGFACIGLMARHHRRMSLA